jgi:Flp pilus assembly protein TadD
VFNDIHQLSSTAITIMFKHIFVSGLTLVYVLLVVTTNSHAEGSHQLKTLAIKNVTQSVNNINRSTSDQITNDSEKSQIASNSDLSMRYVGMGWAAQKRGEDIEALIYYRQAIELDETNAVAFMALGTLLDKVGKTEEAIISVKVALVLFAAQDNKEGQDLGMSWLEAHGVNK